MSSNLPVKRKEGLFEKIKNFFKNLFGKQEIEIPSPQQDKKLEIEKEVESTFKQDIQVDKTELDQKVAEQNKELEREQLFMKYTQNPEMIASLSDKMLDQLISYGEDLLEKEKEKKKVS